MKHLFSSGEIMNHQHERMLAEGRLVAETLEYGEVGEGTEYACHGTLEGNPVTVRFTLDTESQQHVDFRHMLGILMQSDIYEGVWNPGYVVEPVN
jgi:hypothetical protein